MFNGYTKSELYVPAIYSTLKEEIFQSGFINIKQWNIHLLKAKEYKQTIKVKNMKYKYSDLRDYDINLGNIISLYHLLCIILYCDTNELQSNFSASFRKNNEFDTIQEIKKRHQKYHHFGKGLVETVHCYGVYRGLFDGGECGPFYCGLNKILNIGQFDIYLRCPTSTSKDIEIAINFATRDGLILTLNNDSYYGQMNNMINCNWISRYSEENERLWIGYQDMKPLRIESIRIIDTNKKYTAFFHALWIFDMILSGRIVSWKGDVTRKDVLILQQLIDCKLGTKKEIPSIDRYILNCFDLYLLNKTNIILNMDQIYKYIYNLNECNLSFLFYDLHPREKRE